MIRRIDWPIISSAVNPNNLSAAAFHDVTIPCSVLLAIASSDDAIIAASSSAGCGSVSAAGASILESEDDSAPGGADGGSGAVGAGAAPFSFTREIPKQFDRLRFAVRTKRVCQLPQKDRRQSAPIDTCRRDRVIRSILGEALLRCNQP